MKRDQMQNDRVRDLEVLLAFLLNRPLRQAEVGMALGISRTPYYDQKAKGQLASPQNLLSVAAYFGLNPVDLLLRYGYITLEEVHEAWRDLSDRDGRDMDPLMTIT